MNDRTPMEDPIVGYVVVDFDEQTDEGRLSWDDNIIDLEGATQEIEAARNCDGNRYAICVVVRIEEPRAGEPS